MTDGLVVRPAGEDDLAGTLRLLRQLHLDDPPLDPDAAATIWREVQAHEGRTVLVAELGGVTVGTVDCLVVPNLTRGGAPYMLVENVVVDDGHRRAGVGRALLAEATRLASAAGCYKVQLLSAVARDAHAFYGACGFEPVAQGWRRYLHR